MSAIGNILGKVIFAVGIAAAVVLTFMVLYVAISMFKSRRIK